MGFVRLRPLEQERTTVKHPHVMVDLETLDTGSNAAIFSIGAVAFTPGHWHERAEFYTLINPEDCLSNNRTMSMATVRWWMEQDSVAKTELVRSGQGGLALAQALTDFSCWFQSAAHDGCLWGNGASFDNVILANAYEAVKLPRPWSYKADRCFRTAVRLLDPDGKLKPKDNEEAHNALADARWQAEYLDRMLALDNRRL